MHLQVYPDNTRKSDNTWKKQLSNPKYGTYENWPRLCKSQCHEGKKKKIKRIVLESQKQKQCVNFY